MLSFDARDDVLASAVRLALDLPLPERGCATGDKELFVLRLSPEAYLIVTRPDEQYAYLARLSKALASGRAAVTDVSSGYATLRISGPTATELLYRGCSIPLDPPEFVPGNCVTTSFGKLTVIIHWVGAEQGFDLHVPRSLALSFWRCLADAGRDADLLIAAASAEPGRDRKVHQDLKVDFSNGSVSPR